MTLLSGPLEILFIMLGGLLFIPLVCGILLIVNEVLRGVMWVAEYFHKPN